MKAIRPVIGKLPVFLRADNSGFPGVRALRIFLPGVFAVTCFGFGADECRAAGTGKPEITVQQPFDSNLVDGKAKRSFGTVAVGKSSMSKAFRIRNIGTARLTGLFVSKVGVNVSDFVVGPIGTGSLAPGESTIFKVQFKPAAKGTRKAALRIKSNDANENPFDIVVTGAGA